MRPVAACTDSVISYLMSQNAREPAGRGSGVAAVVVGAATLAALIVMIIWIVVLMSEGAGGFAIMSVRPVMAPVVLVLGILGVILSVAAIIRSIARRLGITGLLLSAAPLVVWIVLPNRRVSREFWCDVSRSAVWLLCAFVLAALAYAASLTIGFVAPVILIVLGAVAAVVGVLVDLRSRPGRRS